MHAELTLSQHSGEYDCSGAWTVAGLKSLPAWWHNKLSSDSPLVKINGKELSKFDSAGALLLLQIKHKVQESGGRFELVNFTAPQHELLELVSVNDVSQEPIAAPHPADNMLTKLGKETVHKLNQCDGFIILIGDLCLRFIGALGNWRRFQWNSIVANIDLTGVTALPIVAMLSFLIGVVLTYQMGLQLQTYGATLFIAYLSGMALFREFAPLITAIIIAGRTSSSFTAQIGSMKVNEEIDAIKVMGLSPTELLVMPKVLGLLLVFPLLIFWADVFSVLGSMIMAKLMLGVSYADFLIRLKNSVGFDQFMIGMSKAPVFACLIALVGCFQGFLVGFSADSIGKQTTKSVVQAIFLIIIADALFSVIYSWMGI